MAHRSTISPSSSEGTRRVSHHDSSRVLLWRFDDELDPTLLGNPHPDSDRTSIRGCTRLYRNHRGSVYAYERNCDAIDSGGTLIE